MVDCGVMWCGIRSGSGMVCYSTIRYAMGIGVEFCFSLGVLKILDLVSESKLRD